MTDVPTWHDDSAARHWRLLIAVVAPAVAVATLAQSLLDVLGSGERAAVLDGLTVRTPGWPDPIAALIWAVTWAYALAAVMIAFRGTLLGEPPTAFDALRQALRRMPTMLGVLVLAGIGGVACVLLAGVVASFAGPLALLMLAAAVFGAASLVGALPVAALDGLGAWESLGKGLRLAEGRRWGLFFRFLGLGLAWLPVSWLTSALPDVAAGPITAALGRLGVAGLTVAAIALQGTMLARWRVQLDVERPRGSAPCPGHWLVAGGGLVVAVVGAAGLVIVNPHGVPVLTSAAVVDRATIGAEYAVTRAGAAVAATDWECWDCETAPPPLFWDSSRAILDDGTALIDITYAGNGPIQLTECHGHACTFREIPLDRPGFYWDHWVVRALPDGGLLVVAPVIEAGMLAGTAKLVAWICADHTCASARRVELAEVTYNPPENFPFAVTVGPEGTPVVAYGTAGQPIVNVIRCADRTCGRASTENSQVDVPGENPPGLVGLGFDRDGRPVAVLAGKTPETPAGVRIQFGRTPRPRVISVTCHDDRCAARTTRAWNEISPDGGDLRAWAVAMPDGHLAILLEDARGARLITCEEHCEG